MDMDNQTQLGREIFNIPFGDIIQQVALGIADAQFNFDKTAMMVAEQMSGRKVLREAGTGEPILDSEGNYQTVPTTVFFGYELRIRGEEAGALLSIDNGGVKLSQLDAEGKPDKKWVGSHYDSAPTVKIEGDGQGAKAEATLNPDKTVTLEIKEPGTGYNDARLVVTGGKIPRHFPKEVSMIELGFVPNFYQFVDTVIEMKMALRVNRTSDNKYLLTSSMVDANYASSYNYSLNMATTVKTKIVPIPPPIALEDRVRQLVESNRIALEDGQIQDTEGSDASSPDATDRVS